MATVSKNINTTSTATVQQAPTLAPVLDALHGIYREVQARVLEKDGTVLPDVVFTVQRSAKAWGHVTVWNAWQAQVEGVQQGRREIMISGENLSRGAVPVLGTLLHESAHVHNIENGVQGVDANGRHNLRFKKAAETVFGLTIEKNRHGWSETSVPESTQAAWSEELLALEAVLAVFAAGAASGTEKPKAKNKNLTAVQCTSCGVKVRMSEGTFSVANRCVVDGCDGEWSAC
jgi:hypothetical protein